MSRFSENSWDNCITKNRAWQGGLNGREENKKPALPTSFSSLRNAGPISIFNQKVKNCGLLLTICSNSLGGNLLPRTFGPPAVKEDPPHKSSGIPSASFMNRKMRGRLRGIYGDNRQRPYDQRPFGLARTVAHASMPSATILILP